MKVIHEEVQIPERFPIPLQRSVIVKRAKFDIESSIILPDTVKTAQNEGYIMAIGPEIKGALQPKMRVVYNYYANMFIIHEGIEYLIVHENNVYGVITKNDDGSEDLVPFNMSIFIETKDSEFVTEGGIRLPNNQAYNNVGYVLGVGENVKSVKKGDKVIYNIKADFEIMWRGKRLLSMSEIDIFCIIPSGSYAGNADLGRERRRDYSINEMPDIEKPEPAKGTSTHYDKLK